MCHKGVGGEDIDQGMHCPDCGSTNDLRKLSWQHSSTVLLNIQCSLCMHSRLRQHRLHRTNQRRGEAADITDNKLITVHILISCSSVCHLPSSVLTGKSGIILGLRHMAPRSMNRRDRLMPDIVVFQGTSCHELRISKLTVNRVTLPCRLKSCMGIGL